jgi:hypothetical protein
LSILQPRLRARPELAAAAPLPRTPWENPERIRKIAKAVANSPFLLSNRGPFQGNGPREYLRELALPEMRPDLLRPD